MTFFAAVVNERAEHTFKTLLLKKFDGVTTVGLLLTLVLIFAFQGNTILEKPLHIVLIAVPLVLQTFLVFAIAYLACKILRLPHDIASPAAIRRKAFSEIMITGNRKYLLADVLTNS